VTLTWFFGVSANILADTGLNFPQRIQRGSSQTRISDALPREHKTGEKTRTTKPLIAAPESREHSRETINDANNKRKCRREAAERKTAVDEGKKTGKVGRYLAKTGKNRKKFPEKGQRNGPEVRNRREKRETEARTG